MALTSSTMPFIWSIPPVTSDAASRAWPLASWVFLATSEIAWVLWPTAVDVFFSASSCRWAPSDTWLTASLAWVAASAMRPTSSPTRSVRRFAATAWVWKYWTARAISPISSRLSVAGTAPEVSPPASRRIAWVMLVTGTVMKRLTNRTARMTLRRTPPTATAASSLTRSR